MNVNLSVKIRRSQSAMSEACCACCADCSFGFHTTSAVAGLSLLAKTASLETSYTAVVTPNRLSAHNAVLLSGTTDKQTTETVKSA